MSLMRRALLAGSTSAWLRERASGAAFVRKSVSRFMPGETMDEALGAAQALRPEGISTILTRLGENITRVDEAEEVTQHYFQVLDKVAAAGLDAHVSVKPTQLGLDQDPALCRTNIDRLIERTEQRGNFLWLDMESSPYVDPTLDLYRYARAKTPKIGIAIQAYLYRTGQDVESLIPLGSAIRIVKGAYLESPDVAFPKKSDVDESFYTLCTRLLQPDAIEAGCLLHIATHDTVLLERLRGWIAEHRIPASAYEFAMLYGIQRGHQQRLVKEGERMRVLVSYGEYWFPWYMRRLAERPANVWFVMKNMFG